MDRRDRLPVVTALALVVLGLSAIGIRMRLQEVDPAQMVPQRAWNVELLMEAVPSQGEFSLRTFAPTDDARQQVGSVTSEAEGVAFSQVRDGAGNMLVQWGGTVTPDQPLSMKLRYQVRTREARYDVPAFVAKEPRRGTSSAALGRGGDATELGATEAIQSDDPEVVALAERLGLDTLKNAVEAVRRAHGFAHDSLTPVRFSGETTALVALRLREASCNGKSRLETALLRHAGVPARLVGGILMERGTKRTSHQWVEARLGDQWVPSDPLNDHLFELPAHYLVLYRGDEVLLRRSAESSLKYEFAFAATTVLPIAEDESGYSVQALWRKVLDAGLDFKLLRLLLMLPFGALITVLFRNVIGITTFGTFLPVLIAGSFQDTGLLAGLAIFLGILTLGAALRLFLEKLRLLHTPKLTILLVVVILGQVGVSFAGVLLGLPSLSHSTLLPVAVMAITIERLSLLLEEGGMKDALKTLTGTVVVVSFCYLGMLSLFLQTLVTAFPEFLLLLIACAIWLGRWKGLRLMEFWRFRKIIFTRGA